ncbi:MAG: hypothetical protein R3F53_26505 [Gammaproteobacteria bacterium]
MVQILSTAQPYPGLRPFYSTDAEYFFGREAHITALYKKLLLRRFVAVIGASGSGKSSLVRAGLHPMLDSKRDPGWHVVVLRPESAPFRVLTDKLLPAKTNDPDTELRRSRLLAMLERDSDGLSQAVAELELPKGDRFLLVVDQFEELIRYDQATVDTSLRFIRLLLRSATQRQLPIHIMLTMRLDFLGDCARYPGLTELINEGQYLVPALDRLQRRDAIEKPARLGGKSIDPELVQTLLNDADDAHDQLPVLQHALMRLWQAAEQRGDEHITLHHYQTIGTLKAALSKHANEIFDQLAADLQPQAEALFKAITDLDRQGRGIRRPQQAMDLARILGLLTDADPQDMLPAALLHIIDPFRAEPACFLLPPAGETIKPDSTIDISHESLIQVWDKFDGDRNQNGWLHQEAQDGKVYSNLVDDARGFARDHSAILPPATASNRLRWWHAKRPNPYWGQRFISKPEGDEYEHIEELLSASKKNLKRQQIKKKLLTFVAIASVLLFAGFSGYLATERSLRKEAEVARQKAEAAEAKAQAEAENARQAQTAAEKARDEARQALKAKLAAEQAQRQAELEQQKSSADAAAERSRLLANQTLELARNGAGKISLALAAEILANHDNSLPYVAETEQAAYAATRAPLLSLNQEGGLYGTAFSADGSRILSWLWGVDMRLWDANNGALLSTLSHDNMVYGAVFNVDGSRILSWSADSTARLWDANSGKLLLMLPHDSEVYSAAFSADGSRILSWSKNTVRLWDTTTGALLVKLPHETFVMGAALSTDGSRILSWSESDVWLWDTVTGASLVKLPHETFVMGAALSTDGSRILSWESSPSSPEENNTVWLWDAGTGRKLLPLEHEHQVTGATFTADGRRILSWSRDSTVRLWDTGSGKLLFMLQHEQEVLGAVFSSDETRVLTWSENNVWLWDASTGAPLFTLRHENKVLRAMVNADASRILSQSSNGLWLWSTLPVARYPKVLANSTAAPDINLKSLQTASYGKAHVQFSANGTSLVSIVQNELSWWQLPDGKPLLQEPLQQSLENTLPALCNTAETVLGIATDGTILSLGDIQQATKINYSNPVNVPVNVIAAAFTPNCEAVAVLLDNTRLVLLQKNPDWQMARQWQINLNAISQGIQLAIDPHSQRIIGVTESGYIFDTASAGGSELKLQQDQTGRPIALHAERGLVAYEQSTRGGMRIAVWSVNNGKTLLEAPLPAKAGSVLDAVFSPDGQRLLLLTQGEAAQLWDVQAIPRLSNAPIGVFGQTSENFLAVAYGPDNQQIAVLNSDGSVKLWPIFQNTQGLVAFIRDEIKPAPLTDAQRCQYGLLDMKACAAAK